MTGAIWEFTPGTNTWLLKNAVLPVSRGYIPTLAVYDFKVGTYLIYTGGGSDWNGTTLVDTNDSFKYDPIADSISTIASIPRATGETRAVPWAFPSCLKRCLSWAGGELRLTRPTKWTSIFRSRRVGACTITSSLSVAISQLTATAAAMGSSDMVASGWQAAMPATARRLVRWKSTVIHARRPRQLQQQRRHLQVRRRRQQSRHRSHHRLRQ